MARESYDGMSPKVHPTAFVHASAHLIGEVELAEEVSIWPTCVLRGDNGFIRLGARTNFQDGSVAHATLGASNTSVGADCTIGHRVILHGCTIGNSCLIGMGSVVMDNAEFGDFCFVAAGSLVTPRKKFPPRSFISGSPARVIREVKDDEVLMISHASAVYRELAAKYRAQR